jgi:hypothetical protein
MEVHHHPEVPHGKLKHFKEYFLEFLMIFLAVTMGFIAENIREHISDSSKESEYITGMVKNLETDTANLKVIIKRTRRQLKGIDTLRNIPKEKLSDIKVQDSLYRYTTKYLFILDPFKNDDATLIQLRNAGGYRLIRNPRVLDSIAGYESKMSNIDLQVNYLFTTLNKSIDAAGSVFDFNVYAKLKSGGAVVPALTTNDKSKIYSFYNQCWIMSIAVKNYDQMLEDHLAYTTRLITFIKKEYDVE